MVSSITGSPKVKLPHADGTSAIEIDFTPPFRRISVLEELEKQMQVGPLPDANDPEQLERWLQLCDRFHVPLTERTSLAYVIDKLVGRFVEKHCIQPTFLINHPLSMSPLAKPHSCIRGVTERFELFIGTKEYVNAYTELNEPELQRKQFSLQTRVRGMHLSPLARSRTSSHWLDRNRARFSNNNNSTKAKSKPMPTRSSASLSSMACHPREAGALASTAWRCFSAARSTFEYARCRLLTRSLDR